jgi:hypothetical protein
VAERLVGTSVQQWMKVGMEGKYSTMTATVSAENPGEEM